jgi:hypothetical protein
VPEIWGVTNITVFPAWLDGLTLALAHNSVGEAAAAALEEDANILHESNSVGEAAAAALEKGPDSRRSRSRKVDYASSWP